MELHKTPERTKSGFVLLDQNMRLVKPVNEYLGNTVFSELQDNLGQMRIFFLFIMLYKER